MTGTSFQSQDSLLRKILWNAQKTLIIVVITVMAFIFIVCLFFCRLLQYRQYQLVNSHGTKILGSVFSGCDRLKVYTVHDFSAFNITGTPAQYFCFCKEVPSKMGRLIVPLKNISRIGRAGWYQWLPILTSRKRAQRCIKR